MGCLLGKGPHAYRVDRANLQTRAATGAEHVVQVGQERTAHPRSKTDGLNGTALTAGLAGDVAHRKASVTDEGGMGKARSGLLVEYGFRTAFLAGGTEGTFASRKVDARKSAHEADYAGGTSLRAEAASGAVA
ncbi:hypothetical protein YH62_06595 [Rhizobium sp. LC145]|nr:hypothetical protein YH62_06595 [Rhizobium sp. LC145]